MKINGINFGVYRHQMVDQRVKNTNRLQEQQSLSSIKQPGKNENVSFGQMSAGKAWAASLAGIGVIAAMFKILPKQDTWGDFNKSLDKFYEPIEIVGKYPPLFEIEMDNKSNTFIGRNMVDSLYHYPTDTYFYPMSNYAIKSQLSVGTRSSAQYNVANLERFTNNKNNSIYSNIKRSTPNDVEMTLFQKTFFNIRNYTEKQLKRFGRNSRPLRTQDEIQNRTFTDFTKNSILECKPEDFEVYMSSRKKPFPLKILNFKK